MHGCTDERRRKRNAVVTTTNAIYRCEEWEDAASIYDDIKEDNYHDLNESTMYLDIISDETAKGCDPQCPPQLPSPRPVPESPDKNKSQNYGGLNKEQPGNIYLQVLSDDESTSRGSEKDVGDQDLDSVPREQDWLAK